MTEQNPNPEETPKPAANESETPYVPPALAPWPPAADEQPTWQAPPPPSYPPSAPASQPAGGWQQPPAGGQLPPPSGPASPLPPGGPGPYPPAGSYPTAYPPAGYGGYGYPAAKATDSKAIVAIIMALGSFVICPGIMAVIAIVLAVQSDRAIAASNGQLEGHGMNVASKWIAGINLVLTVLGVVAVIIFGVVAATHPEVIQNLPTPDATAF